MENKLEQLLNSLIEKGWKPRGWNWTPNTFWVEGNSVCWNRGGKKNIRELVAKESGLWQFVCENKLIKEGYKHERILDPTFGEGWADCKRQEHDGKYGYRLIESALKDESELESFILDNIKL